MSAEVDTHELAMELVRAWTLKMIEEVAALAPAGSNCAQASGVFWAGNERACEEIVHRLKEASFNPAPDFLPTAER